LNALRSILDVTRACGFCGFCEAVCPTYNIVRRRHYGPRGRVAAAEYIVAGGNMTPTILASIYTCLLCHACFYECPIGIDVAELVRTARSVASLALRGGGCSIEKERHVGCVEMG